MVDGGEALHFGLILSLTLSLHKNIFIQLGQENYFPLLNLHCIQMGTERYLLGRFVINISRSAMNSSSGPMSGAPKSFRSGQTSLKIQTITAHTVYKHQQNLSPL